MPCSNRSTNCCFVYVNHRANLHKQYHVQCRTWSLTIPLTIRTTPRALGKAPFACAVNCVCVLLLVQRQQIPPVSNLDYYIKKNSDGPWVIASQAAKGFLTNKLANTFCQRHQHVYLVTRNLVTSISTLENATEAISFTTPLCCRAARG